MLVTCGYLYHTMLVCRSDDSRLIPDEDAKFDKLLEFAMKSKIFIVLFIISTFIAVPAQPQ